LFSDSLETVIAAFDNTRLPTCHFGYRDHIERLQTWTSTFYSLCDEKRVRCFPLALRIWAKLRSALTILVLRSNGFIWHEKKLNAVSTGSSKDTDFVLFSITLETLAHKLDRKQFIKAIKYCIS
jgi:hypothetical protein